MADKKPEITEEEIERLMNQVMVEVLRENQAEIVRRTHAKVRALRGEEEKSGA